MYVNKLVLIVFALIGMRHCCSCCVIYTVVFRAKLIALKWVWCVAFLKAVKNFAIHVAVTFSPETECICVFVLITWCEHSIKLSLFCFLLTIVTESLRFIKIWFATVIIFMSEVNAFILAVCTVAIHVHTFRTFYAFCAHAAARDINPRYDSCLFVSKTLTQYLRM